MKNPKNWQATPHNHAKPNDLSGSDTVVSNGDRSWSGPTSYGHSAKTKANLPMQKGFKKSEMKSSMSMPGPIQHSGHAVHTSPKADVHKKWTKKGYALGMNMKSDD